MKLLTRLVSVFRREMNNSPLRVRALQYYDVKHAFDSGSVLTVDRRTLEEYLLVLAEERMSGTAKEKAKEMQEFLQPLLQARLSQELHVTTTSVSKASLYVAFLALLVSAATLAVSFYMP